MFRVGVIVGGGGSSETLNPSINCGLSERVVGATKLDPVVDADEDVVRLVGDGNHDGALRLLVQRYGTPIYRYCREALEASRSKRWPRSATR